MTKQEAIRQFEAQVPNRIPVKLAQSGTDWFIYSENTLDNGKPLKDVIDGCFYKISENIVEFVPMMRLPENIRFEKYYRGEL